MTSQCDSIHHWHPAKIPCYSLNLLVKVLHAIVECFVTSLLCSRSAPIRWHSFYTLIACLLNHQPLPLAPIATGPVDHFNSHQFLCEGVSVRWPYSIRFITWYSMSSSTWAEWSSSVLSSISPSSASYHSVCVLAFVLLFSAPLYGCFCNGIVFVLFCMSCMPIFLLPYVWHSKTPDPKTLQELRVCSVLSLVHPTLKTVCVRPLSTPVLGPLPCPCPCTQFTWLSHSHL